MISLAGILIASGLAAPAFAQSTVPNPLRGRPVQEKPAEPDAKPAERAKPEAKAGSAEKPKRERSAKQKENDDIMRACGASWREEKASLQAKGETWRNYLKTCRARKKSEQKA